MSSTTEIRIARQGAGRRGSCASSWTWSASRAISARRLLSNITAQFGFSISTSYVKCPAKNESSDTITKGPKLYFDNILNQNYDLSIGKSIFLMLSFRFLISGGRLINLRRGGWQKEDFVHGSRGGWDVKTLRVSDTLRAPNKMNSGDPFPAEKS